MKLLIKKLFGSLPYKYKYFLYDIHKFIKNSPKFLKYYSKDLSEVGMIGNSILLESSGNCQLKCPSCSIGRWSNARKFIGKGYLKFEDFKKFVDKNSSIKNIELSNWGEVFLNPELKDIIKYSYDKKINLIARNGVNLNNTNKEVLEYLVKYKFRYITISIDGATNNIYRVYRRGGDLNRVIENIKTINFYKKRYNSEFPILSWQFIIMGHNEYELPIARKKAKELNMIFLPKLSAFPSIFPIKDEEFVKRESGLGVGSKDEFRKKYKRNYLACKQFWISPQINWDGRLLGCCLNMCGDFGNVFESSLDECLKSEKYIYAKKMLLGKEKAREDIACSKCWAYKEILKNPLKKKDIII